MSINAVDLVACVPTLRLAGAPAIETLARAAVDRRHFPGERLFEAGDAPTHLVFVLEGRVLVERWNSRRTSMLHSESRGGVLGEIPVFGKDTYPATATAMTESRCAYVAIAVIDRLLRDDPGFARFALARLATRARSLLARIDELTASTVNARLAAFVQSRSQESGGAVFTLGTGQAQLATELGTAREVVVRGLTALIEAGALRRAGRSKFVVADARVLRAIACAERASRER